MANTNKHSVFSKQIKFIMAVLIIFISCQCAKLPTPNTNKTNSDFGSANQQPIPISDTLRLLSRKWVLDKATTTRPHPSDMGIVGYDITDYSNSSNREFLILLAGNKTYSVGITKSDLSKDSIIDYGIWSIAPSYQNRNHNSLNLKSAVRGSLVSYMDIFQIDTSKLVLFFQYRVGGITKEYKSN